MYVAHGDPTECERRNAHPMFWAPFVVVGEGRLPGRLFLLAIGHGPVSPRGMDDWTAAILQTDLGLALIDDRVNAAFLAGLKPLVGAVLDDAILEEWLQEPISGRLAWEICGSRVPVAPILRRDLGSRFAFDPAPQPPPGAADC